MFAGDSVCHGEPHSGSLPGRLGGEERFKNFPDDRFVHARPAVFDADAAERAFGFNFRGRIRRNAHGVAKSRADAEEAAVFRQILHGVARIDHQIENRLLKLSAVAFDCDSGAVDIQLVADSCLRGGLEEIERSVHNAFELQRLNLPFAFARISEKLACELACLFRNGIDFFEVRFAFLGHFSHVNEVEMTVNRMNEIVEVVRDSSRKPSDCFETLTVFVFTAQKLAFLLQTLPFGDIASDEHQGGVAVHGDAAHGKLHFASGAGEGEAHDAFRAFHQLREGVAAQQKLVETAADEVEYRFCRKHFLRGLVGVDNNAVRIGDEDHVGCVLDDGPAALLRFPQILFQAFRLAVASKKCENDVKSSARIAGNFLVETGKIDSREERNPECQQNARDVFRIQNGHFLGIAPVEHSDENNTVDELSEQHRADGADGQTASVVLHLLEDHRNEKQVKSQRYQRGSHVAGGVPQQARKVIRQMPLRHGEAAPFGLHSCNPAEIRENPESRHRRDDEPLGGERAVSDVDHQQNGDDREQQNRGRNAEFKSAVADDHAEPRRSGDVHHHHEHAQEHVERSGSDDPAQSMQNQKSHKNECGFEQGKSGGVEGFNHLRSASDLSALGFEGFADKGRARGVALFL